MKISKETVLEQMDLYMVEYKKLLEENEELKLKIEELENENIEVVECLEMSNNAITESKKAVGDANELMIDMRKNIDYYEQAVVSIMDGIYEKVQNMIEDKVSYEEGLDELKKKIETTKKEIQDLNKEMQGE